MRKDLDRMSVDATLPQSGSEKTSTGRSADRMASEPPESGVLRLWSGVVACCGSHARSTGPDIRAVAKNTLLFAAAEQPNELYILLEGAVARFGIDPSGNEITLRVHEAGEAIGLPEVLSGQAYAAGARAAVPVRLLCLPAPVLRDALARAPACVSTLVTELTREGASLLEQLAELSLRSAPQRLGRYLLGLTEGSDARTVSLPHDKHLIAAALGMSAETLSRCFATLKKHGLEARGSRVSIADEQRLRDFCSGKTMQRDATAGSRRVLNAPSAPEPSCCETSIASHLRE
jgi:CRP-like cAMP-binding protein